MVAGLNIKVPPSTTGFKLDRYGLNNRRRNTLELDLSTEKENYNPDDYNTDEYNMAMEVAKVLYLNLNKLLQFNWKEMCDTISDELGESIPVKNIKVFPKTIEKVNQLLQSNFYIINKGLYDWLSDRTIKPLSPFLKNHKKKFNPSGKKSKGNNKY